ncbi:MAG: hypothetical protein H6739_36520 [Alphaproteobacteria bacterium]|nr:hypothetical protein [Alphaproteobacteria bacterium]
MSFLLHAGATVLCPHGGSAQAVTSQPRVTLSKQPVTTVTDSYLISACPFTVPAAVPQPCVTIQWIVPATRVFVGGSPVLLSSSSGLCQSATQIPQGSPIPTAVQARVRGQ